MEIQEIKAYKIDGQMFDSREAAERHKYALDKIEMGDTVCTNRAVAWEKSKGIPVPIFAYGVVEEIWEQKEYMELLKVHKVRFTESVYFTGSKERMIFFRNPLEKHLQWIKGEKELHRVQQNKK